jgi:hypothetical protein
VGAEEDLYSVSRSPHCNKHVMALPPAPPGIGGGGGGGGGGGAGMSAGVCGVVVWRFMS